MLLDGFPRSLEQEGRRGGCLCLGRGEGSLRIWWFILGVLRVLKERYVKRGRGVDDGELFEKRFEQHERECLDVVALYREKGVLVEVSYR